MHVDRSGRYFTKYALLDRRSAMFELGVTELAVPAEPQQTTSCRPNLVERDLRVAAARTDVGFVEGQEPALIDRVGMHAVGSTLTAGSPPATAFAAACGLGTPTGATPVGCHILTAPDDAGVHRRCARRTRSSAKHRGSPLPPFRRGGRAGLEVDRRGRRVGSSPGPPRVGCPRGVEVLVEVFHQVVQVVTPVDGPTPAVGDGLVLGGDLSARPPRGDAGLAERRADRSIGVRARGDHAAVRGVGVRPRAWM
jgi:hypothetical protein